MWGVPLHGGNLPHNIKQVISGYYSALYIKNNLKGVKVFCLMSYNFQLFALRSIYKGEYTFLVTRERIPKFGRSQDMSLEDFRIFRLSK